MASYPTGVFSPAAKSGGQTIQAAHVNDLDGEVVAVENALLNGIAHAVVISTGGLTLSTGSFNAAGPSSLATLQVNGTSTFAGKVTLSSGAQVVGNSSVTGNLQVTGDSTFTGNVVITGSVQASNIGSLARVKVAHSTTQAVPASAWTGLSWDVETYNPAGMHSTAANSSRITFADSTGIYAVGFHFLLTIAGSPSIVGGRVLLNSTTEQFRQTFDVGASTEFGCVASADIRVSDTTDFITLEAFHDSGSTCSVSTRALGFWARKVSS